MTEAVQKRSRAFNAESKEKVKGIGTWMVPSEGKALQFHPHLKTLY